MPQFTGFQDWFSLGVDAQIAVAVQDPAWLLVVPLRFPSSRRPRHKLPRRSRYRREHSNITDRRVIPPRSPAMRHIAHFATHPRTVPPGARLEHSLRPSSLRSDSEFFLVEEVVGCLIGFEDYEAEGASEWQVSGGE